MTIKSRLQKLESKQLPAGKTWRDLVTGAWKPDADEWRAFLVRVVDYRAGLIEGVEDAPGDIPIRLVDYTRRDDDHKKQITKT